jgi:hypothetical protein
LTYHEIIDRAVREKAEAGATLAEITFPLANMIATTLANVVVENRLDAAEEIENVQRELEALYEKYLVAYNQQTA